MTEAQVNELMAKLPKRDHAAARAKILYAQIAGFTMIGLWEVLEGKASSHLDLVGVNPRGEFDFLSEPPDVT